MHAVRAARALRRCGAAAAPLTLLGGVGGPSSSARTWAGAAPLPWAGHLRTLHAEASPGPPPALEHRPPAAEPADARAGPLHVYGVGVASGKYRADPQQMEAIRKLQRVWEDVQHCAGGAAGEASGLTLVDAVGSGSSWSLWDIIAGKADTSAAPLAPIRGLYLYGGVGTGKTMLMDVFFDALPPGVRKKRIHFHDFLLDVHRRLRLLTNVADPLVAVAEDITRVHKADGGRMVLCLDEFMVTDVADAMIMKRLFQRLFDCGLVLIATSNRAPDRLYERGLQRALFVPFIELLKQRCDVHDIQGLQDYRRLARKLTQSLFFVGPAASAELQCCLEIFASGQVPRPAEVTVMMGRTLHVPRAAGRVALFSFAQLCETPVAAADYIALCEQFHTVLLDGVPRMGAATRAAAYRLVTLVDVAYEQKARLICAAEAQPAELFAAIVTQSEFADAKAGLSAAAADELCVDDNVGFSKERTISRLIEMQSVHYAREHAARRAPELLPSLPPEDGTVV